MAWLSDSYDEIVDSLGEAGSNAGGGGFARLASTIIGKLTNSIAEVFYYVNYVNVNYSLKNSTVDCKYLLFLQDFLFRLKPKQYKKCQYS